jgi:hypothetical protein
MVEGALNFSMFLLPRAMQSQGPATTRLLGHYWLENSPLSPLGVVPTANVSAVFFGPVAFLSRLLLPRCALCDAYGWLMTAH